MHKSQLAGFIIDCETGDLDTAAEFWGAALGYPAKDLNAQTDDGYVLLDSAKRGLHIELQQVTHPSRVHLDIETDDLDAEVARLEKLGAKRLQHVKNWWVMEAPTGHRFCVVLPQDPEFAATANRWGE